MENDNKLKSIQPPLTIFEPDWGSSLAQTIIELERLRVKKLSGAVPPYIFFQLKDIFQMLESLGSARIEGNRTTLAEFIEKVIELPNKITDDEKIKEIFNIEKAIQFIDENITYKGTIQRSHISEIHKILMDGLSCPPQGEGSRNPGDYRKVAVIINRSKHVPPDPIYISEFMDKLIEFINQDKEPQYDLLITALSHHCMAWIHPFDNGNGRSVRMFTYAMLIKQGFQVKTGRILNPTAIFCMDRSKYYDMLELADSDEKEKVLQWCEYVLNGLKEEMEKIDKLLNKEFLIKSILLPAISFSLERENITIREFEILRAIINNPDMCIKSSDIELIIGKESVVQRSRIIKKLKDKGMLVALKENGRVYTIGFSNNYLLRGIINILDENKFIPHSLNKN